MTELIVEAEAARPVVGHPARRPAPRFATGLRSYGQRVAVVADGVEVSYAALHARAADVAARLGPHRRLVLVAAENSLDALVGYLGALQGGHPVLLAPAADAAVRHRLEAAYDPDVVLAGGEGWAIHERRDGSRHELHPDLALLLPTSGSTGSAKLVRLSAGNLEANAASIATYLHLTPYDRAMTTLPMHYCYGLSVIHSHLERGAALVLTGLSVADRCFWDLFRATGATSFAGVPHTFELLDRTGFAAEPLPTLRYVTQAGGRLPPGDVRRYAALGERAGWEFFVMYGQTEATARMAYLPPELAASRPGAIGVAIPGGSIEIEAPDGDGVGELVYRGPNVMLGYADDPKDLRRGATVERLRTGDLGRQDADGLFEVVGRRSRFVKPFGLRVDLDGVERLLADASIASMCAGDDRRVVVAVAPGKGDDARGRLHVLRLPRPALQVVELAEFPLLANGKPDYAAVLAPPGDAAVVAAAPPAAARRRALGTAAAVLRRTLGTAADRRGGPPGGAGAGVRAAFADVLGREPADHESFVDLGGDSLSYVEVSVRLEQVLGTLPADWPRTPVGRLSGPGPSRRWASVETTVVLRAVAIVLIVGTHARLWYLPGGAHTLLGVVGFNAARFRDRPSGLAASVARLAVPSLGWIWLVAATTGEFTWRHALLLNVHLGPTGSHMGYWFVETVLQILAPLALLLAVPAVRRFERVRPFGFAVVLALTGLSVRFDLVHLPSSGHGISRPWEVLWLVAAGWAAAQASSPARRLAVSAMVVAAVPGFFGAGQRELVVGLGLLLMVWVRAIPVPRPLVRGVAAVAGASLAIYLTHFQVFPPLVRLQGPALGVAGSVAVGVLAWSLARRFAPPAARWFRLTVGAASLPRGISADRGPAVRSRGRGR